VAGDLLLGGAAQRPQPRHLGRLGVEPAIGVEQAAVGRDLDQRAVVMLAVNFDQRRADGAQHLHRHRLIVEEGAGAAVGELDPAQDQLILGRDVVCGEDGAGRMVRGHVERSRDLALLRPLADEAGIAAPAERERKGIEQDRFTGAGFPGEHREARRKVDVEAVDQDDVSDRKPGQHQDPRGLANRGGSLCSHPSAKHSIRTRAGAPCGNSDAEPVGDQRSVIPRLNLPRPAPIH
jgi:hypothetical protein